MEAQPAKVCTIQYVREDCVIQRQEIQDGPGITSEASRGYHLKYACWPISSEPTILGCDHRISMSVININVF